MQLPKIQGLTPYIKLVEKQGGDARTMGQQAYIGGGTR